MTASSPTSVESALTAVRKDLAARLTAAAELVAAEHRKRLGGPNPSPHADSSKPGEYPRRRTGRGLAAVHVEKASAGGGDDLAVRVVVEPAGGHLELLAANFGRKGLDDTVRDMRSRIEAVIAGGGKS